MDQNEPEPPQRYLWPRFVLAGVVLGIVLAVFWMSVLVRRVHEQREDLVWPTQSAVTNPPPRTNATPTH